MGIESKHSSVVGPGWKSSQAWLLWISTLYTLSKDTIGHPKWYQELRLWWYLGSSLTSLAVIWLSQTITEACPFTCKELCESTTFLHPPALPGTRPLFSVHYMPITASQWDPLTISKGWGQCGGSHTWQPARVIIPTLCLVKWPYARSPFYKINFGFTIV